MLAFGYQGKIDHHDRVLLHDADQQKNADTRHDVEFGSGDEQRDECADAGGRQSRQNCHRMNEAFVKNAEHDIDGQDCAQEEQRQVAHRLLENLQVAGRRAM